MNEMRNDHERLNFLRKRRFGFVQPIVYICVSVLHLIYLFVPQVISHAAECITISDAPLETPYSVSSVNVMFALDDSGSMDWEILVTTDADNNPDGLFDAGGQQKSYLFDEVKEVDDSLNLYPEQSYSYWYLKGSDRAYWQSQYYGHNQMYYNPSIEYTPWYTPDDSLIDADPDNPRFHPWNPTPTVSMSQAYLTIRSNAPGTVLVDDVANSTNIFRMKSKNNWDYDDSNSGIYDGDEHTTQVDGEWAEWYLDLTNSGSYDVGVYVTDHYTDSDTKATYHIIQNSTTKATLTDINQNDSDNGWIDLGTYSFSAGTVTIRVERTAVSTGYTAADAARLVLEGTVSSDIVIPLAHYYVKSAVDNAPYLVILDNNQITYYKFDDADNNGRVDDGELTLVNNPPSDVDLGGDANYTEARQNFANWYSYYRKRWYAALNAIGKSFPYMIGKKVGYRSINSDKSHPKLVQPVQTLYGDGVTAKKLLDELYGHPLDLDHASTPLRIGLEMIGLYFDTENVTGGLEDVLLESPLVNDPYASCTQNYVIILTDGAWNGGAPLTAGADKDAGPPFADKQSGMLADVAYAYYQTDLAPGIENLVPTSGLINTNAAQHMVTYGITFGTKGHINPDDYDEVDLYNVDVDKRITPPWPTPSLDFRDKIDDLYHATVNGRGKYHSSSNPKDLENILQEVVQTLGSKLGSGASVSINGEEIKPDSGTLPHIFQAGYVSDGWSGDVMAFEIDETGRVRNGEGEELWLASKVMDEAELASEDVDYWDTGRAIVTYSGGNGKRFRYDQLTTDQKDLLSTDAAIGQDILHFLRGDHSREMRETGGIFRNRVKMTWDQLSESMVVEREPTILGDVVHSAPHYVDYGSTTTEDKGVLFVGGNDGMLHAFAAKDGKEIFAYVPNIVFENLKDLSDPEYSHKYYVDLTPFSVDMGTQTYLVGGLGKGGKGFYCLDITDLSDIEAALESKDNSLAETKASAKVKWEYPTVPGSDPDLGYTFSRPFLVNTNAGWVVIAGNGYNSTNGNAVLYVLDPETGAVKTKIDTLSGTCNGLSTPLIIDVNNDGKADYVYAGDMNGNMWKFNITDSVVSNWKPAFYSGTTPMPLFTALDEDGKAQPITSKPDAMYHCSQEGVLLVFGTGRYLAETDFTDTSLQTIYGIWDFADDSDPSEYLGQFTRSAANELSNFDAAEYVGLLEQTQVASVDYIGSTLRVTSQNYPNWETVEDSDAGENPNPKGSSGNIAHAGWYFDLPISKERVVQRAIIRNNIAIVVSYSLESDSGGDLCKPERSGTSIVHEFDACTGARVDEAIFDINNDGVIDDNDLVEITVDDPDNSGSTIIIKVPPTGISKPGLIYPPKIIVVDDSEIKYFSSSRRTIETIREVTEPTGMYYWKEIQN